MLSKRAQSDIGVPNVPDALRYIAACDYETNNEYWQVANAVVRRIPTSIENPVILDLACGPGTLCECIHRSRSDAMVIGVDANSAMITHATKRYRECAFVRGRAEGIPFETQTIDAVVSLNAVHHFVDVGAVIAEIERVLKPG